MPAKGYTQSFKPLTIMSEEQVEAIHRGSEKIPLEQDGGQDDAGADTPGKAVGDPTEPDTQTHDPTAAEDGPK